MVSERDRLTAQVAGIGAQGIAKLQAARILVVGAGGLGSPVLAYLAAAGVGTIGISDPDCLEESNLQRQVIHGVKRLGQVKSHSAATTIKYLNPQVNVEIQAKICPSTAVSICRQYDLVVDATDNFDSKFLLSDTCYALNIPHIWGTLVGMSFQLSVFAQGKRLRDLYPHPPQTGQSTPTSAENGVLGAVCGQAGSIMATEAIKYLTGAGTTLIGKLLIVDAAAGKWNLLDFHSSHSLADSSVEPE